LLTQGIIGFVSGLEIHCRNALLCGVSASLRILGGANAQNTILLLDADLAMGFTAAVCQGAGFGLWMRMPGASSGVPMNSIPAVSRTDLIANNELFRTLNSPLSVSAV